MPLDVIMPALGMAQETGQIVAWHKQPGDAVAKGDVLFEVETDKATMEVEAQGDGFLTDVTASEGSDIPVGNVIAKISDTAEGSGSSSTSDAAASPDNGEEQPPGDTLPEGKAIIMPTLGMAQDTGLLVMWHKAAGDAVGSEDVLFEVETDKSTVEVNAGADGYLAAILAGEGDEVPVGQTIAIISAEAPDNPITRTLADAPKQAPAAKPEAKSEPKPENAKPAAPAKKTATKAASPGPAAKSIAPGAGGRVLASPKARRLAREQGLDLGRLVEAGYTPPFHVKDLDTLKALPAPKQAATGGAMASSRLTAELPGEGFSDFARWAATHAKLTDPQALLAGLCAASMGEETIVAVESFGQSTTYAASARLGATELSDEPPQLCLRDLRFTAITSVQVGGEDIPTLTLTRHGTGLAITLEYAGDQLGATDAIALLSNFAGRMEQPLRHLL